jgi:predicted nucleic-acid-binding protein
MQWQRNTQLIDANVILRYLLNDHAEMSLTARTLISSGNAYTKPEIISEVVYVLKRVYQIEKEDIKNFIHALLNDISCNESECVLLAIDIYASVSLDFVDCLLIAYHRINHENIFSFDQKLNKHLEA